MNYEVIMPIVTTRYNFFLQVAHFVDIDHCTYCIWMHNTDIPCGERFQVFFIENSYTFAEDKMCDNLLVNDYTYFGMNEAIYTIYSLKNKAGVFTDGVIAPIVVYSVGNGQEPMRFMMRLKIEKGILKGCRVNMAEKKDKIIIKKIC